MEGITHALSATVLSQLVPLEWQTGTAVCMVVGSLLPDADSLPLWPEHYLRVHRGPTHSLCASPVLALALTVGCYGLGRADMLGLQGGSMHFFCLFLAALSGVWLHLALDWINSFGTQLLWPLSRTRHALDLNIIVDPFITLPMLAGVVGLMVFPELGRLMALGCLFWLVVHLIWSALLKRRAVRLLASCGSPVQVFPRKSSGATLFSHDSWVGLVGEESERRAVSVFRGRVEDLGLRPPPPEQPRWPPDSLRAAFLQWARAPAWHTEEDETGVSWLRFEDVRFIKVSGDATLLVSRIQGDRVAESRFSFRGPVIG